MRIVIDMQGIQASNAQRGIGRYSSNLVNQLIKKNKKKHEMLLLLNGMLSESINYIYNKFCHYLPKENIIVWSGVSPANAIEKNNNERRKINEKIREDFINKISPDILLITSLFEGLYDDAVTSIRSFDNNIPTAIILYDLIPLIHKEVYLKNSIIENWYLEKIDHLRRANLLLSISNSTGNEAIQYLGFHKSDIFHISIDCTKEFKKITFSENERIALCKKFSFSTSFILYTGGIDYRKNIERLLQAFSLLPQKLRMKHQLVIVCSIADIDHYRFKLLCKEYGLDTQEVIFTGYISQYDLVALYNICNFFIFPSLHEGFGLPILEAMRCGKAVIGGSLSSIPEVIRNKEALFNPYNVQEITDKIIKILTDENFKISLEKAAEFQAKAFSLSISAEKTWKALEDLHNKHIKRKLSSESLTDDIRQCLAFISPLPPAKSGIANYSAELISELSRHYLIDVIVDQDAKATDSYIIANCNIRDVKFFKKNAERYKRILYHFGNSSFHVYMFKLLYNYPGVVVLHDFFLSSVVAYMDIRIKEFSGILNQELHKLGGWPLVCMRYTAVDIDEVIYKYPCNISVLQNSIGVIVHSNFSRKLASKFYGPIAISNWDVIPHLRTPAYNVLRLKARQKLGIDKNTFVVCSFGFLGPTKMNHKLLSAWLNSPLSNHEMCILIFVGENNHGKYGTDLLESIKISNPGKKIQITGWRNPRDYKMWLSAADVAVQLRTLSRGETSGTILDCMNYGLATIVNANGAMTDLDDTSVIKLTDKFKESDLINALTLLYSDVSYREKLKFSAIDKIRTLHKPRTCAEKYKKSIELFYKKSNRNSQKLIDSIIMDAPHHMSREYLKLSTAIAKNYEPEPRKKQIFVDISELVQRDVKSGIQRVVRAILNQFLHKQQEEWIVEPVYANESSKGYYYARNFTCKFLNIPNDWIKDSPIETWRGDIFLGLDLQPIVTRSKENFLQKIRHRGISLYFVVYDLLPILSPEFFFPDAKYIYEQWLSCITQFDGAICISQTVADELTHWIKDNCIERSSIFDIQWFHLGADLVNSVPSSGKPVNSTNVLKKISERTTFLMVGTVEPRKHHAQVLGAFELLWKNGKDINLVIVGKQGWMVKKLIDRIYNHKELNNRLFWLSSVSDEYLKRIYSASKCLIAASAGEGFCLPLVEAAAYNVSIIARDIPVFREVAGEHALYFNSILESDLSYAIEEWLILTRHDRAPSVATLEWLTWEQSANQLLQAIFKMQ